MSLWGGSNDNLRETIQSFAANAKEELLEFKLIEATSMSIPEKAFETDSWWTSSVRLDRSVALDTRQGAFTNCLMSYEPCLNPASSRQQRLGTAEETNQFEEMRENDNALRRVYYSVPSSCSLLGGPLEKPLSEIMSATSNSWNSARRACDRGSQGLLKLYLRKGGGHATKYRYYGDTLKKEHRGKPAGQSHWVLMTTDVIPASRSKALMIFK